MSEPRDPPRLRTLGEELPAELNRALASSPAEEASREELEAVRVMAQTALPQLRATAPRRSKLVPPALGLGLTFVLGVASGVTVAGGVYLLTRPTPAASPSPSSHSPQPAEAQPRIRTSAPRPLRADAEAPTTAPMTAERPPLARQLAPPSVSEPAASRPHAMTADAAAPDELSLLTRAQNVLPRDPAAALELAADHAREFPEGALGQEREVIAIDALLRLGRRPEAMSRAAAFHRRFPASAHGRRVDVLLGVRSTQP